MTISPAAMLSPLTVVAALSFLAASVQGRDNCNHNECYQALNGRFGQGKTGAADCSSFLLKTATPATTTHIATVTATYTVTITTPTTTTVPTTATDDTTLRITATDYASTTTTHTNTVTVTLTSTTVLPIVAKRWVEGAHVARQPGQQQGQQQGQQPKFPSYCDNECSHDPSQFSSACSCLGVQPMTTTVAAPSITVTVTVTANATNTMTSLVVDVSTYTVTETITLDATSYVTFVISSFTSTTATATATDVISQCTNVAALPTYTIPFPFFLSLKNSGVDTGTASSEEDCCVSCYETTGCAAYFFYLSLTDHHVCDALIVENDPENFNNPTTPFCPLGKQNLNDVNGDSSAMLAVKPGPCAAN